MSKNVFRGCASLTIYCEVESKSYKWEHEWNSSNCDVIWEYKEVN